MQRLFFQRRALFFRVVLRCASGVARGVRCGLLHDDDAADRPGKGERIDVVGAHRRAVALADVGGLVERDQAALRLLDPPFRDFFIVDKDAPDAALAEAAPIVGKFVADRRLARRDWLVALDLVLREAQEVVIVDRLSVLEITITIC
jgi:hypothetical protein